MTDDIDPAADPAATPGPSERLTRSRRPGASRLDDPLRGPTELTTTVEADVTEVGILRMGYNALMTHDGGTALSYLPFVGVAAIEALRGHPQVNARVNGATGAVTRHDAAHVGFAVATDRGLVVPVVRDAAGLQVVALAERIAGVVGRAGVGTIGIDELAGGTFTITEVGGHGVSADPPIIHRPQVAVLGVGTVRRRPVGVVGEPRGGSIASRTMMRLALTFDHTALDADDAAQFVLAVKDRLEQGEFDLSP